jgi:hypothetical protein
MHRKGHTKRTHTKKRRTMKGGFYGASGAIAPGAMEWKASSEMGHYAASNRGGNSMIGARRRRKGKKSRKVTRRHRGGSKYGAVAAGFQGSGSRGMIDVERLNTKGPVGSSAGPSLGAFNDNGVHPGGSYDSFIRSH